MYNSKFICTYSFYDPDLRNKYHTNKTYDLEDVEDFEDLAELVYKADLLRAFGEEVGDFENNILFENDILFKNVNFIELYNQMKNDAIFVECVEKSMQKHFCEDLESGFIVLFSYDYFFLTHNCICSLLNNKKMSQDDLALLKKALE
jgi:hypothetical protein